MRVLFSAYACAPNRGSEPEIGWQRALHMLAHADEVWVLTRANNREAIEADPRSHSPRLHFLYCDLPNWVQKIKKHYGLVLAYSVLWQWGAYRMAGRLHNQARFDCVYHVTFSGILSGTFMGRLGIPFIVGPVAGGERAPIALRRGMPMRCQAQELLRDLGIIFQRYSPLSRGAFAAAQHIYVTTTDSMYLVAPKWRSKTEVHLSIAIQSSGTQPGSVISAFPPRFVFVGRLLHWKGAHLAIQALAEAKNMIPEATLTLMGSGPDERWLRKLAMRYGVLEAVHFRGQLPRKELVRSLGNYTAFVFPSLHDSGGSAVLEAMQAGLPVVCLDLGGPGVMVNSSCGIVVSTKNADTDSVVSGIAHAMTLLGCAETAELQKLSAGAIARANELSWTNLTEHVAVKRTAASIQ